LSVTILEDRLAPALLTVNSLADGPISAASSTLTLREAIVLIDSGGTATDSSGNSLAAAKASQINPSSPFGSNDVIQFAPNLFGSAQQQIVLVDGNLLLDQNAIINGPVASQLAVSGNNQSTVFGVAAGATVSISGLTVEDGAASGNSGGGIVNGGTLTLSNVIVADNTALQGDGGGIYNTATLTLLNSAVSGNTAFSDGGIFNSGTLTLTESTVSGNTAVVGNGGLANYGGVMALIDSTVSGNMAIGAGGIGNYDGGIVTVLNSTISGNSASVCSAGGIYNTATLTLTGCTVTDNTAVQGDGGGIDNTATLTLVNSSVSGNAAFNDGDIFNSGLLTLTESTISGNTAVWGNGGAPALIDSTVSGNTTIADSTVSAGIVSTAVPALTERVSGDSSRVEYGNARTDAQTLAASIRLPDLADGSANIAALLPNDGAVSGRSTGVGNDRFTDDGDTLTPIDHAQSGRSPVDSTVSSDSASTGNSGAETIEAGSEHLDVNTGVLPLAHGAVSSNSAADAGEVRAELLGQGQEVISLRSRVQPAGERAVSAVFSESHTHDDRAERCVLPDREGVVDQELISQAEWEAVDLAGLLMLSWFPIGGCLLEEQSGRPQEL